MQEQHEWMDVERRSGTYDFGRREGLQEGACTALRELILGCLEDRRLTVDDESTARILACEDVPTLQRWARRSMSVATVDQLFA